MVNDFLLLTALRAHLKTLTVATTGVTSLAATADGFTRDVGSFIDDGFVRGMEVKPSGFADNTPAIVTRVDPLTLYVEGGRTAEALAIGRSLVVGLPEQRAWENMPFTPEDGRWYIDEDYLPGPSGRATLGKENYEIDAFPTYVIQLYGLGGKGVQALYTVASQILLLFRPNLDILMAGGNVARVRSDTAPFRGQVVPEGTSHALITITIPLWVRVTT